MLPLLSTEKVLFSTEKAPPTELWAHKGMEAPTCFTDLPDRFLSLSLMCDQSFPSAVRGLTDRNESELSDKTDWLKE